MPVERPANPALLSSPGATPRAIGVIGAGSIGPDIGYYLKSELGDTALVLVDLDRDALSQADDRFGAYVEKGLARGKLTPDQAESIRTGVRMTQDYAELAECDWVIEAATENLSLKRKIFSQVEALVRPDAMITSNTSSLPASRLFCEMAHPERATVTHFFAPAFRNPIVEVVDWRGAAPQLVDRLCALFCATGKVPLVTADVVCFMLDRVFDNWCNEAALLLDANMPAEIDSAAMAYVHAGPFHVLNLANGNPIIIETNSLQAAEEGEHYAPAAVFEEDPEWETVPLGRPQPVSDEARRRVQDRLLGVLFSQSSDILERRIGEPGDLEIGCRLALGFKEGPLGLARSLGDAEVVRIADEFSDWKTGMPRGDGLLHVARDAARHIVTDDFDGARVITLRRPDALNALHDEMTDEILAELKRGLEDDAVESFIITGYGPKAFCAGADIGRFPSLLGDREACVDYAKACSRLLMAMDACPKPIVAALNGLALGGGLELAMRCDAMAAVRGAYIQFPEISLGIAPGIGALAVPYRRFPNASETFHRMLLHAEKLTVDQAHAYGIVAELADDPHDVLVAAHRLAGALIAKGKSDLDGPRPIAPLCALNANYSQQVGGILGGAIEAAAAAPTLSAALQIGYDAFGETGLTAAAKEGIGAFLERRAPNFEATG